ncbi:hypothetical protein Hdeb2414_s0001g00005861 [Helianthus debilis subsp. tardiflorus]
MAVLRQCSMVNTVLNLLSKFKFLLRDRLFLPVMNRGWWFGCDGRDDGGGGGSVGTSDGVEV